MDPLERLTETNGNDSAITRLVGLFAESADDPRLHAALDALALDWEREKTAQLRRDAFYLVVDEADRNPDLPSSPAA